MRYRLRTLMIVLAVGPPALAILLKWKVAPEISEAILFILYQIGPPLLVTVALGIWARTVFWLLAQVGTR